MYLKQVAIAFDQFCNALAGGWADETISSRAYRMSRRKKGWRIMRRFIDCIFFWQDDHCYQAWVSEKDRKHFPKGLRRND